MNYRLIYLFLFLSNILLSQSENNLNEKFLLEDELKKENMIDKYVDYDFSEIWLKAQNLNVLGVIGKNHQRLKIKFTEVFKNPEVGKEYSVFGKSCVKGVICDFQGTMTLKTIKEVKDLHYGVDNEYENKGIKSQGILIGEYHIIENIEQKHSGIFKGTFYSKWYLDKDSKIKYDDIEIYSDGYMNNQFVGFWSKHNSTNYKNCNWGDFRIMNCNEDFDIGSGEFSPNDKYLDFGWSIRRKAINGDKKSIDSETEMWWK